MASINPDLIKQTPKPNGVRHTTSFTVSLLKNAVTSAIKNTGLKVGLENEDKLQSNIKSVITLLNEIATTQKKLEIGKASLSTQSVDDFRVNNLEKLNLENVESLSFAFEQLNPIIKSLQSSNNFDKQTISLLNKLYRQVVSLEQVIRMASRKDIKFPDTQKVAGTVSINNFPDAQRQIVAGLSKVESLLRSVLSKPEKENKIELAEGKMLSQKLDALTTAIGKLPGNMEFPTTVSVDNFPPQKVPLPPTHVSINSLTGYVKSRAVTVTTTPTPLPSEVLSQRRSLVVYNNSSSTIYIGGQDVSSSNGMPVPATSYSPAIDAGVKMVVYGIVAASTADVRVLELSDIRSGK